MKRRIKKFLRSIGVLKPKSQATAGAGLAQVNIPNLYMAVLKRAPRPEEMARSQQALASGQMGVAELVSSLLDSDDYATGYARHAPAADTIARAVLGTLINVTDERSVQAYSTGLQGGLSLADFLAEICGSNEFQARWQVALDALAPAPQASAGLVPASDRLARELGQVAEGLIAARLIREGVPLGLPPPLDDADRPPVDTAQLLALIRTLDMMADARPS